jgi:hypothetical protein
MEREAEFSKLNLMAFGWALSTALIVLFILCEAAAIVFPGWQLAHGWLALFSTADVGSVRNLMDGIVFSVVFGWITAGVLAPTYNWFAKR